MGPPMFKLALYPSLIDQQGFSQAPQSNSEVTTTYPFRSFFPCLDLLRDLMQNWNCLPLRVSSTEGFEAGDAVGSVFSESFFTQLFSKFSLQDRSLAKLLATFVLMDCVSQLALSILLRLCLKMICCLLLVSFQELIQQLTMSLAGVSQNKKLLDLLAELIVNIFEFELTIIMEVKIKIECSCQGLCALCQACKAQSFIIVEMESVHQCPHYQRNCHVEAPCCKIFYPCKLCHDEKFQFKKGCQVERMEFEKVQKIKCLQCQEVQDPVEDCIKCGITFGEYACIPCRLYENNPDKVDDIFHCDDCKMCRRGDRESFTHCNTCGYCVPSGNGHKCISNNAQSRCPVCLETLLYSTNRYINLPCGHLIHIKCQQMLNDLNCPSCGMAWYKMKPAEIAYIDQKITQTKDSLPEQLKNKKVNVLCNECLHKTTDAEFHYYGIKCVKCGTFNTKMI